MSSDATLETASGQDAADAGATGSRSWWARPILHPALRYVLFVPVVGITALAVLALGVAFASGAYQARDRSATVAHGVFATDDEGLDIAAASAALARRFPDGSRAATAADFLKRLGGSCTEDDGYPSGRRCGGAGAPACDTLPRTRLRCEVPVVGGYCSQKNLLVLAHLHEDRTLTDVRAVHSVKCSEFW